MRSLFELLEVHQDVPDHSTVSRKVETTLSRYKTILGPAMRPRRLANQRVEARIGCKILNLLTALGMPEGYMVK